MSKNIFSVRLDPELSKWVYSRVTKYRSSSDVMREVITKAFEEEKKTKKQDEMYKDAAKKSIVGYRVLERVIRSYLGENQGVLDEAISKGLQDVREFDPEHL